jgi:hypothetical protein
MSSIAASIVNFLSWVPKPILEAIMVKLAEETFLKRKKPVLLETVFRVSYEPDATSFTVARESGDKLLSTNLPLTCRFCCANACRELKVSKKSHIREKRIVFGLG